ncbi:MAG: efflux RND transporter periplasmic adaptor subunit [Alphaproteobacteria bacterium]|nr:efflux RND transporter periplasmic adaptor subunit [Alphaproteobacteria bacterium]
MVALSGLWLAATAVPSDPALAQAAKRLVAVEAVTLQPQVVVESVSSVGDLASEASVIVRPEIAGRVTEIGYVEGARVEAGAVLVRLDDAIYRGELDQAKARRDLSARNYERAKALNQRGHSSEQALDIAREEVRVNEASVELAEARLQKTIITAPFAGEVGLSAISVGDYIKAGDDIVNLEQIVPLKVDFRLPERYLRLVAVGRPVDITLDAFPGKSYLGEVYAIDPRIRANDRSIGVRARLPNAEGRLRPGLFARVRMIVDRRDQALVVPEEALVPRGDHRFVFRIIDGKAVLTEVKIGLRETGKVEIVEGLQAGDVVITAGQAKVREGSAVRIVGGNAGPQGKVSSAAEGSAS